MLPVVDEGGGVLPALGEDAVLPELNGGGAVPPVVGEGGGVLPAVGGGGGVLSALDDPSLPEVVGVAEFETFKEISAETDTPPESCKLAVNEKAPGAVGVPDRAPAVELSERPGGRSPVATLQEYGGFPPLAVRVAV